MPKTLTPNPNNTDATNIQVPLAGERATPESIEAPLQKLLDRIAKLDAEVTILETAARAKGIL